IALSCFQRARRLAPSDERPLLEIARTYAAVRNPRRALRWYRRAVGTNPRCVAGWLEGARCHGRYACLRRSLWLQRALALRSNDRDAREEFNQNFARLRWWERRWVASRRQAIA